jgi:hypothetical protein
MTTNRANSKTCPPVTSTEIMRDYLDSIHLIL